MAGTFSLLYTQAFSSAATITVTHALDRVQVAVIVRVGNESRNDLISSVAPDPADPRNATIVTLASAQTGDVLVLDSDYVFAAIPTPENAAALSGGTALTADLADAAGDLLVATAADTVARLAVGTDTHVLTADSAEPGGMKWAAGGGGSAVVRLAIPFGARLNDPGRFAIFSGKASDGDVTNSFRTRAPIPYDGDLVKLAYCTATGDVTSVLKIHINGVVEQTINLSGSGGAEALSVSVSVGDYLQVEFDGGADPSDSTILVILEAS